VRNVDGQAAGGDGRDGGDCGVGGVDGNGKPVGDDGAGGVCCIVGGRGDCGVSGEGGGGGGVQGRGESSSASSSSSSLSNLTSHRHSVTFWVRLVGGGEAVGKGCDSGTGGAGGADGAVWSTEGGSSEGDAARFFGRGSQSASAVALDDVMPLMAVAASRSQR
jgi:hypothetical protein